MRCKIFAFWFRLKNILIYGKSVFFKIDVVLLKKLVKLTEIIQKVHKIHKILTKYITRRKCTKHIKIPS